MNNKFLLNNNIAVHNYYTVPIVTDNTHLALLVRQEESRHKPMTSNQRYPSVGLLRLRPIPLLVVRLAEQHVGTVSVQNGSAH